MSKTFATIAFDTFSQEKDVVVLRAFATDRHQLSAKRILPKRTKDYPGAERTEMKVTLSDPTLGIVGIISVSTSIRADTAAASRDSLVAIAKDAMADPFFTSLVHDQKLPLNV